MSLPPPLSIVAELELLCEREGMEDMERVRTDSCLPLEEKTTRFAEHAEADEEDPHAAACDVKESARTPNSGLAASASERAILLILVED